jgi:hypothetical protein
MIHVFGALFQESVLEDATCRHGPCREEGGGVSHKRPDTVGEITLIVLHTLTLQVRQKLTGVFWPEASPPTML